MNSVIEMSNPIIFESIGIAGFCLYVCNYLLLTFRKLHSTDPAYFAINLAAATCVLVGLLVNFNLASAMIQMFWVVISTTAILLRLKRGSPARQTITPAVPAAFVARTQ